MQEAGNNSQLGEWRHHPALDSPCQDCNLPNPFKGGIWRHRFDCPARQSYLLDHCGVCENYFGSVHACREHVVSGCFMKRYSEEARCPFCCDSFSSFSELYTHKRTCGWKGYFYLYGHCAWCNETFGSPQQVQQHWRDGCPEQTILDTGCKTTT